MGVDDFIADCKREEDRHVERCVTDPDYCLAYIRSWGESFGIFITCDSLNDLTKSELESLIGDLKLALNGCQNSAMRAAVQSLIAHAQKKRKELEEEPVPDDFTEAVRKLGGYIGTGAAS